MKKKTVLVTGTGGRSVGSGILHSLLFSSKEVASRWNVIASDATPFAWGLYKCPNSFVLPMANDSNYLKILINKIRQYKIDAIIPGAQPEVEVMVNNIKSLNMVKVVVNRKELIEVMMDKSKLTALLKKLNLPYIETLPLNQWRSIVNEFGFPVIIKPSLNSGGSKGLYFIQSQEELNSLLKNIDMNSKPLIQPYIGKEKEEYTVGVINDKDGNLIDSIIMRRELIGLSLLCSTIHKGKKFSLSTGYSQGYFIKDKKIQRFCENLAIKLRSEGPLNIQLRMHKGQPYVFELHPRFSGTTPMRADVGFNEVDILLRNYLFNEKFFRLKFLNNVAAIRAFEHVIVPISKLRKSSE